MNPQRLVYHLCRLILGGVFLYAGTLKAQDVDAFAGAVAGYQLFPYALNYLVAATLPWLEILAGALLVVNRHARAATLVLAGMTGVFVMVLVSALVRGVDVDCGCFAAAASTTPLEALVRDLVLLGVAHAVFHLRPSAQQAASP